MLEHDSDKDIVARNLKWVAGFRASNKFRASAPPLTYISSITSTKLKQLEKQTKRPNRYSYDDPIWIFFQAIVSEIVQSALDSVQWESARTSISSSARNWAGPAETGFALPASPTHCSFYYLSFHTRRRVRDQIHSTASSLSSYSLPFNNFFEKVSYCCHNCS